MNADSVTESEQTQSFTYQEFGRIMRCSNFIGAVAFWRSLERLTVPEESTRSHALGVLRELARRSFEDCAGFPFSPQHAECLEYCGFAPIGVRSPGSATQSTGG